MDLHRGRAELKVTRSFTRVFETRIAAPQLIDDDGKLLVAGTSNSHVLLARLNDDIGSVDQNFGAGGVSSIVVSQIGYVDQGLAVAIDPQQRIIVSGDEWTGQQWRAIVVRALPDGTHDLSFGDNGCLVIPLGPYQNETDEFQDLTIQPDGRILLAGTAQGDVALALIMPDNTLDVAPACCGPECDRRLDERDRPDLDGQRDQRDGHSGRSLDRRRRDLDPAGHQPRRQRQHLQRHLGPRRLLDYSYRVTAALPNNAPSTPAYADTWTLPNPAFNLSGGARVGNGSRSLGRL